MRFRPVRSADILHPMTRILPLILALLIAVTSQQMAMARGMTKDASGQVILCTGQGPTVVTLDAQGNPMGPVHICPDCALTVMAFADAPAVVVHQVVHIQSLTQTPVRKLQPYVFATRAQARGPPLAV